jgi:hypothetical protein
MKIRLEELVRETLEEMKGASMGGFPSGFSFVGRNIAPKRDGGPSIKSRDTEDIVPEPRARVSSISSYKKCYSYLMGSPRAATTKTVDEILDHNKADDPQSCAQGIADYLNDHASAGSTIA